MSIYSEPPGWGTDRRNDIKGVLLSALILLSFTAFCAWWVFWVLSQQDASGVDWPVMCRPMMPEDLGR